jgi:hypothetical protein
MLGKTRGWSLHVLFGTLPSFFAKENKNAKEEISKNKVSFPTT